MATTARAVFITGGGSGLGAATARLLAGQGWRVAIVGRDAGKLAAVAAPIAACLYALDVSDAAAVTAAIDDFRPDALVCAAAILGRGAVWDALTPQKFAEVQAINVGGTFNACAAAMKQWRAAQLPGDIVNISSLAGIRGMQKFSGFAAYAASKHAVVGLTEALALEGKPLNIRVNAIAPGTLRTPMMQTMGLQPRTTPEAVAPSIEFLLDRARSGPLTGTILEVHCNDD